MGLKMLRIWLRSTTGAEFNSDIITYFHEG